MNLRTIISLSAVLTLLCGCGQDGTSDATATWQVDTAAVLQVGTSDGDAVYQLYRVRGIAELPHGQLAIANSGSSEIRVYDATGRFVRALGRAGEGPGEFTILRDLHVHGDTIWAYDRMAGRLTRFLSSGAYLDDSALRPEATRMTPSLAGLLRDGTPVGWVDRMADGVDGFQRDSAMLLRFAADGTLDTLGVFAGKEFSILRRDLGGGVAGATMYSWGFYRAFLAVVAGDRIYGGVTDSAVIHVWDAAGAPLPSLRWRDVPRPLDDAAVDALFERETRNLEPAERAAERRVMRGAPRPPTAPVFDRLVVGPDGELWVRRFDAPGTRISEWLVFDTGGLLRARVAVPREREVRAIGRSRIYTIERDEYDVEYVRAYPLMRPHQ